MFNKRKSHSQNIGTSGINVGVPSTSTGKVHSGVKSTTVQPNSPEAAVVFPQIKVQDNAKLLPKYTAALNRAKDEYFPAEDLDAVQLELEQLLSSVALRYRVLKSEYESLDKDDKKDRRSNKFVEKQPTSPGKRKRGTDDKKSKDRIPFKLSKQKLPIPHSPAQSQHTDDSMDSASHYAQYHQKDHPKVSIPKNDTPNKFWLSVEPYCMPLTNEDLKLLDDLLDQYSGPLVPPIPDLGPHYSTIWAEEDLKDEQDASNVNKNRSSHKFNNNDASNMLKRGEKLMGEGVTGPLTQRLVSALIEENLMPDVLSNADSNSSSENTSNSTASTLRSLQMMKNGINIERSLKKELIEQGLLDPDSLKGQDDEILSEIKRVVAELSAIAEYNSNELKRLQTAAKAELQRLEVKRKLDAVDQEIIEMYKKVVIAKQKRRPLTTEEHEEIYRLTAEQKRLSDQLETMPVPGPNYLE